MKVVTTSWTYSRPILLLVYLWIHGKVNIDQGICFKKPRAHAELITPFNYNSFNKMKEGKLK